MSLPSGIKLLREGRSEKSARKERHLKHDPALWYSQCLHFKENKKGSNIFLFTYKEEVPSRSYTAKLK